MKTHTNYPAGRRPFSLGRPFRPPVACTILAVDVSASMSTTVAAPSGRTDLSKLDAAKEAAVLLARHKAIHTPADRLGVVGFGSRAFVATPPVLCGHPKIAERIHGLRIDGSTNLEAGLVLALSFLERTPRYVLKQATILTDGQPDSRQGLPSLIDRAKASRVRIHTIGVGRPGSTDLDEELLRQLAGATHGGTYRRVTDLNELVLALRVVG
ncbi:MAG: VWA domain-containing protein [Planctomycetota bacterium]|nr:VWA domain-containing protein [Planctomycetota bacterium]